eukprot:TRINITY_DN1523_c0_g1_i1.p1 TRINITY_DN1523_c0_g1~~TRINITY_DN1523_c0_g1_i1.p1  ORF type:complete len:274 (-),score=70.44 TRINITY_DN1523_c0_g1_i1:123-944(-)
MWGKKLMPLPFHAIVVGASTAAMLLADKVAHASNQVHAPEKTWTHSGPLESLDRASVRRGFQVYKEVCASCHGLKYIAFRNFIGSTHTEEQAKALAASYDIKDGPDAQGEMFDRPGKLFDYLPSPYANEEAARAANGGALPPDLSVIVKGRHGGEDYIFSLLTGYKDPPAGIKLREGLYYNPYFPGGAIGMPPPLNDGQVDYEDGTPATQSQMAKDVSTFLVWTAMPEHDDRKLMGLRTELTVGIALLFVLYWKRFRFASVKSQRVSIKKTLY